MAVSKKLIIAFISFYVIIIVYLLLFLFVPDIQNAIIEARENLAVITEGSNYFWMLLISLGICFLGSASIGFPIPFPLVLFSFSDLIYHKYSTIGLNLTQILQSGSFWIEILGIAIIGGLGSALGESTGYALGYSTKKIAHERKSKTLSNVDGFGKLILENKKRAPLIIFLFALTPLPDDLLFLPLGMIKYPFWKCIIPGWLGKNFTTLIYCCWPIFIELGVSSQGIESNNISSIVIEAILLLITISVMFFIMTFDWKKYLEKRKQKKQKNKLNN
jgi:membrane protein YqaA with SNARE-associated domain